MLISARHGIEFWGDDYQRGSFRNWLKSKYTGPYRFDGMCEDYDVIQQTIGRICRDNPEVELMVIGESNSVRKVSIWDVSIAELEQSMVFEHRFGELLEKLEVTSVLAGKDTLLAACMATRNSWL